MIFSFGKNIIQFIQMRFKRKVTMLMRSKAKCVVSGALAFNFFVSSLLGIAPVRLIKRRDGWVVRMSPFMRLYSYAFIIIVGKYFNVINLYKKN